jgi:hypothetical protein
LQHPALRSRTAVSLFRLPGLFSGARLACLKLRL